MFARATLCSLAALALVSCDSPPAAVDAATLPDVGMDAGTDAGPPPPDFCAELSIPHIGYTTGAGGTAFGDLAGDFTVHTADGATWHLQDEWSGCESYVFFVDFPGQNDPLFSSPPLDLLFTVGPRNVQYFFLSDDIDDAARQSFVASQAAALEDAFGIEDTSDADRAFWRSRFHYVTDQATTLPGSIGQMLTAYITYAHTADAAVDIGGGRGRVYPPIPSVFGIDRAQHWDAGDSLSPVPAATDNSLLGMAA